MVLHMMDGLRFRLSLLMEGRGEDQISQLTCSGAVGGTVPFDTNYHAGRCGFMNVFHYNNNECLIEAIPL